jgi:YbbR domain-containing protein
MEKLVQQILAYLNTIPIPKNWVLKLIAFFFALFLWYFVAGEDKVDMNVSIPVELVNLPRDLVVSNQFKKQIEVTVSGQRSLIRGLTTQHITRTVDLSKATPGKFDIENTPESIPFPWGVSVLRLQPSKITLLIDRLIDKKLPVKVVTTGSPPPGFELQSVVLEPPAITVTGPKNILDEEQNVKTSAIDISNLTETTLKQVSLVLPPDINDLIGETVVTAHINITEQMIERQVTGIPVEIAQIGKKYHLPETTITVKAEFPYTVIKNYKDLTDVLRATVDMTAPRTGENGLAVKLTVSKALGTYRSKIRILDYSPKTIPAALIEQKRPVLEGRKLKIRMQNERQNSK